jgi:hypothetical protein
MLGLKSNTFVFTSDSLEKNTLLERILVLKRIMSHVCYVSECLAQFVPYDTISVLPDYILVLEWVLRQN